MPDLHAVTLRAVALPIALLFGIRLLACSSTPPTPPSPPPASGAAEAPAAEPPPAETPAPPAQAGPLVESLPIEVRTLLEPRMIRHGRDLTDLYGAMKAGDAADVARLARAIADEPQVAAAGADDTLNAALPPAFFERQSELARRAEALATVAEAGDPAAIEAAFERLADGCGGCHAPARSTR